MTFNLGGILADAVYWRSMASMGKRRFTEHPKYNSHKALWSPKEGRAECWTESNVCIIHWLVQQNEISLMASSQPWTKHFGFAHRKWKHLSKFDIFPRRNFEFQKNTFFNDKSLWWKILKEQFLKYFLGFCMLKNC